MATRKTSSKAKPKTTTRAKTAAAKTNARTSSVKDTVKGLARLNLFNAGVFAILAVAAGLLMSNASYQLFTGLLAKDELASKASTIFVPAVHPVVDVQLRWAVVVILGLAAITPLLAATRRKAAYQASLKNRVMAWRWIDMGITSALVLEVVALLSGAADIMTLKLIAGLMVVTCALSWLAEKQNADTNKPVWNAYIISLATGTLAWLFVAVYGAGTIVWGLVRAPWYVYGLYAAGIITSLLIARNLYKSIKRVKRWASYEFVERNYLILNFLAKASFAVILIVGLKK